MEAFAAAIFACTPDTGAFEPVKRLTQQGRARDDWGDWFGCDNSTLAWHYPIPTITFGAIHTSPRRSPRVHRPRAQSNRLVPVSRTLERFNRSGTRQSHYLRLRSGSLSRRPAWRRILPKRLHLRTRSQSGSTRGSETRRRHVFRRTRADEQAVRVSRVTRQLVSSRRRCAPGPMARFTWWTCIASSSSTRDGFPPNGSRNSTCAPATTKVASTALCEQAKSLHRSKPATIFHRRNSLPRSTRRTERHAI